MYKKFFCTGYIFLFPFLSNMTRSSIIFSIYVFFLASFPLFTFFNKLWSCFSRLTFAESAYITIQNKLCLTIFYWILMVIAIELFLFVLKDYFVTFRKFKLIFRNDAFLSLDTVVSSIVSKYSWCRSRECSSINISSSLTPLMRYLRRFKCGV